MNYGEIMNDIRFYHDIKQKEMAKILGISRSSYNQYEQQYYIIPLKHLIGFCNYFDLSVDYLLGFSNEKRNLKYNKEINTKEIGIRIRKLRKKQNLKQIELAKSLNIANSLLSNYEKGKILISTSVLYDLCKRFNISSDYILGRTKENKELIVG